MNSDLVSMGGFAFALDLINEGKCPVCGEEVEREDFKDELSRKEFDISGLCQGCQDKTFEG
jgi:transcription initiation factor IIE alpha subunit